MLFTQRWLGPGLVAVALFQGVPDALGASQSPAWRVRVDDVVVDGRSRGRMNPPEGELRLAPGLHRLQFHFGPEPAAAEQEQTRLRFRYRLEGFDDHWSEAGDAMRLSVLFLDSADDIVAQHHFFATGKSSGWMEGPAASAFVPRQEPVAIPEQAARLRIMLASGGTEGTTGFMAVDDVRVSVVDSLNGSLKQIWTNSALEHGLNLQEASGSPEAWQRGGSQPALAQVWRAPEPGTNHALCVLDTNTAGYAEWFADADLRPVAQPGQLLFLEWREMFSIPSGDVRAANYERVPPGRYQFRVLAMSEQGVWTGASAVARVTVLPYFWQKRIFLGAGVAAAIGVMLAGVWLATRRRMQHQLERLERQRAVEQERTRIARDIHDDIGASLTRIALLSELAQVDVTEPEVARVHLDQIFTTAHGLARQLDEIVWAINPAHDTLEDFAAFLCKFAQDYLSAASLRCRLDVPEIFPARKLSSAARHQLFLATKEALHNIVKHAAAGEAWLRLRADDEGLAVLIEDDGTGLSASRPAGDGLGNMKARMNEIGGDFAQSDRPGRGTVTTLTLPWERL